MSHDVDAGEAVSVLQIEIPPEDPVQNSTNDANRSAPEKPPPEWAEVPLHGLGSVATVSEANKGLIRSFVILGYDSSTKDSLGCVRFIGRSRFFVHHESDIPQLPGECLCDIDNHYAGMQLHANYSHLRFV